MSGDSRHCRRCSSHQATWLLLQAPASKRPLTFVAAGAGEGWARRPDWACLLSRFVLATVTTGASGPAAPEFRANRDSGASPVMLVDRRRQGTQPTGREHEREPPDPRQTRVLPVRGSGSAMPVGSRTLTQRRRTPAPATAAALIGVRFSSGGLGCSALSAFQGAGSTNLAGDSVRA